MGRHFDQKIDALSSLQNLQSITFGYYFNQKIDALSSLQNLQLITLGQCFKEKIDTLTLLCSLQSLTFDYDYVYNDLFDYSKQSTYRSALKHLDKLNIYYGRLCTKHAKFDK